jgi:predicted transglutaminase-like cysteine proteinase
METSQLPPITRYTKPPTYASEFIARSPEFGKYLLSHKSKSLKPLKYDDKLAALLQQVNTEGNTKITWTSDLRAFGKEEYWGMPCEKDDRLYDDCDGYAIWKLHRLIELGLPSTQLIFTTAYDETKTYHAVLIVVTDKGDFVLDNRSATVRTVTEMIGLGYNFITRPATGDRFDGLWVEVTPLYPIPLPAVPKAVVGPASETPNPLCPK